MIFSREAAGRHAGLDVIAAQFTPGEKGMIRRWLETTLELEFRSGLGHPLEGFIELQMLGLDADRVREDRAGFAPCPQGNNPHEQTTIAVDFEAWQVAGS